MKHRSRLVKVRFPPYLQIESSFQDKTDLRFVGMGWELNILFKLYNQYLVVIHLGRIGGNGV